MTKWSMLFRVRLQTDHVIHFTLVFSKVSILPKYPYSFLHRFLHNFIHFLYSFMNSFIHFLFTFIHIIHFLFCFIHRFIQIFFSLIYRVSQKKRVMCLLVHKFIASHILFFLHCALLGQARGQCHHQSAHWPNLPMHTEENTGCEKPSICGPINTSPFFFRHPVEYM